MDKNTQLYYLKLLGVTAWQQRKTTHDQNVDIPMKQKKVEEEKPVSKLTWEELEARVAKCKLCDLHKTRTQTVFGVGNKKADLMIIGEAPGANEDKQGEPFVGRAGRLLNSMLNAIGLSREEVYIANILKSRPPNNRDPTPEEVAACTPYLQRQIALVKPRLLLAVGRIAAHHLLATGSHVTLDLSSTTNITTQITPIRSVDYMSYLQDYKLNDVKITPHVINDLLRPDDSQ